MDREENFRPMSHPALPSRLVCETIAKETTLTTRMNPYVKHFLLVKPLIDLGVAVQGYGLEKSLMELVKIRASQINGCCVCLDMHSKEARNAGETEERVLMLSAWRETTLYNEREKAALAWTEALTRLPEKGAPDDIYQAMQANFSEEEQIALTLLVGIINRFNRIGVGFRVPPVSQQQRNAA
jgi:AhpD family alkylhydroperoxidase